MGRGCHGFRLAPLAFVCLWSGGFTAIKFGLSGAGPLGLLAWRYAACVAVLAPLALALRPRLPRGAPLAHLAINALIVQVGYFALMTVSLRLGLSAAAAALIVALQPVLVGLLAPRLVGERVGGRVWLGLVLGLAGAAAVIMSGGTLEARGAWGVLAAAGALATMTAGVLYEKRFGRPHHPVAANLVQYLVGAAATLPLAALVEGLSVAWSAPFALALAYLVLGNSLLSMSLLLAMVRRGEAARVSALFFLVPPVAALIAWALRGEALAPAAWAGMALAAAGVALAARR
ncbi:DMT family transporter [Caldovatus aquaticus]|uniref:DMT family transporter n=1 Tax=Caldovatus aquaticus TaxID=2865671 RepID=UPI0034E1D6FC